MDKSNIRIAVIGAGAAGVFAALSAAEKFPAAEIHIYEASKQALSKVLISGGGRCNVTSNTPDPRELVKNYPRGSKELRGPFSYFNAKDTVEWFEKRGVKLKAEADKRMFPITDSSETIANCLLNEAKKYNVKLHLDEKLVAVKVIEDSLGKLFELSFWNKPSRLAERIILTTGGSKSSFDIAAGLGHQIESPVPSLFSFEINDPRLDELSGTSFKNAHLKLSCKTGNKYEQIGPILITHWGLSGPAIIKISALSARDLFNTNYEATLIVNFTNGLNFESVNKLLLKQKSQHPQRIVNLDCCFDLTKAFWSRIIEKLNIKERQVWRECSDKQLRQIALQLTEANFKVSGKGRFKDEFVTCGGVSLKEVNFKTMESRICPGLFFAGEVLNIDGLTGGFNFQNAWTTGWIAGQNVLDLTTS